MRLDGFAILKYVASHAELFANAQDAVDEAALSILAEQFQAETFGLDRLKRVCKALGSDALILVLEHVADAVPEALIARIDPHHPKAEAGDAAWARSHVMALAKGELKPLPKPQTTKGKAGSGKGKRKPKSEDDFVLEKDFWATSVLAKPAGLSKARGKGK